MDTRLRTNDESCALDLLELRYDPAGPAFLGRFLIRADGYSAELPLWMHISTVRKLIDEVRTMNAQLKSEAEIWPTGDFHRVRMHVTGQGGVIVEGELGAPIGNHLALSFTTDQTTLGPFADDLEGLLRTAD